MSSAATEPRSGPGRPSSGADERILAATLEVLERDGYAGLTTAKVATRSGHNKALISYHFGNKKGLVSEVTRRVGEQLSLELLDAVGEPKNIEQLAQRLVDGIWGYLDRHEGQARIYFDLASQSMVDPEIREISSGVKDGHRAILRDLLGRLEDAPPPAKRDAAVIYLVAALEGLALERLDRGQGNVDEAAQMFVRSAAAALG